MRTIVFYDTETTGLPLFKEPSNHPGQPHIAQIAAHLVDADSHMVISTINLIVKPDGWEIPEEVANIHGITTEMAHEVGVREVDALMMVMTLMGISRDEGLRLRVGHNENFDARILRIALKRYELETWAERFKVGPAECTARMAVPICAIPPTDKMKMANGFHHKTPNLQEAFTHFFGHEFGDAHQAMSDVNACMAVYWAMKSLEGSTNG